MVRSAKHDGEQQQTMDRKQYGNTVDWSHGISVGSSRYAHRLRESGRHPGLGHRYSSGGSKGGYFEHYTAWDQYDATPRSFVWHCGCEYDPWTPVNDDYVSSRGDYRSPGSARPPVVHAPVTKQHTKGGYHSGRHISEGSVTPRSPWTPYHGYDADVDSAIASRGFGDSDNVESAHNVVVVGATVHPSIPGSARPPVVHAPVTKQRTKGGYHSGRHISEGSVTPRSPWTSDHGYDADYVSSAVSSRSFGHSDGRHISEFSVQHNVGQLAGGYLGRAAGTALLSTAAFGTGGALAHIAPLVVSGLGAVGSRVGDEVSRKIKVASNFLT